MNSFVFFGEYHPFFRELEEEKKEAEMMGLDFSKEDELMAVQKKLMMTEKAMMMEKQMMMFKQKQMMMNKQKAMMMRRQKEIMMKRQHHQQQQGPEETRLGAQARANYYSHLPQKTKQKC